MNVKWDAARIILPSRHIVPSLHVINKNENSFWTKV